MLLVTSQVILLLASSGFINRSPEPIVPKPVSLTELKEVETDLKEVIRTLNEINKHPDLKTDHIEAKPVVVKPAEVKKVVAKPIPKAVTPVIVKKAAVVVPVIKTVKPEPVIAVATPPVVKVAEAEIIVEKKPLYIKHDNKGIALEEEKEKWTCVQDTKNGLMWEVKAQDGAMRDADNLYSWFNPDSTNIKGVANGGRCKGSADCDTDAYVQVMNKIQYCGHNDWRLPTREEMQSLVYLDNGDEEVKINKQYFPQTMPSWYWTSSENSNREELAWYVLFRNGLALNDLKERPKHIRLVRLANVEISSN